MRDEALTALTKARYDRQAALYDRKNALLERLAMRRWRTRLWSKVKGSRILEVGVGTGANFPFYPKGVHVSAIDLSDRMLEQAKEKAAREGIPVDLRQMDVQALEFPDQSFDVVVATFVFCSVPDPILGLQEIRRVLKPEGRAVLLEHVRRETPLAGFLMDCLNPLIVRMTGANINRPTVGNIERAGFTIESVESFFFDIVKLIVARPHGIPSRRSR